MKADSAQFTLSGSGTITRVLMPYKASIEAENNVELHFRPTGSGLGLTDLVQGRTDAAMISGPLEYLWARLGADVVAGATCAGLEQLRLPDTAKAELVALLHPDNPVRHLSDDQLRAILSGEVTNWKMVGGLDQPINLILPDELDGVYATLATGMMAGHSFSAAAKHARRTPDILPMVNAESGAIGLLPRGTLATDSVFAEVAPRISIPLIIVAQREHLEKNPKLMTVLNSLHSRAR